MRQQRLPLPLASLALLRCVGALRVDPSAFHPSDRLRADKAMAALPPVRDLSPIYWLHTPKAGSSFETTLAHYACGGALRDNHAVREPHADSVSWLMNGTDTGHCKGENMRSQGCATMRWNYHCGAASFLYFDSGHSPLPSDFPEQDLHHVATMLRDPLQRGISGWHHSRHSCETATTADEYLECTKNCQTQLMSGRLCGYDEVPTQGEYRTALSRLERFGFLGLTGQWDLSICLFHAMHGGPCKPVEFHNVRPGVYHGEGGYEAEKHNVTVAGEQAVLGGYDAQLYVEGEKIFWSRIHEYGVTRESCAKTYCVSSAKIFQVRDDAPQPKFKKTTLQRVTWRGRLSYDED